MIYTIEVVFAFQCGKRQQVFDCIAKAPPTKHMSQGPLNLFGAQPRGQTAPTDTGGRNWNVTFENDWWNYIFTPCIEPKIPQSTCFKGYPATVMAKESVPPSVWLAVYDVIIRPSATLTGPNSALPSMTWKATWLDWMSDSEQLLPNSSTNWIYKRSFSWYLVVIHINISSSTRFHPTSCFTTLCKDRKSPPPPFTKSTIP